MGVNILGVLSPILVEVWGFIRPRIGTILVAGGGVLMSRVLQRQKNLRQQARDSQANVRQQRAAAQALADAPREAADVIETLKKGKG